MVTPPEHRLIERAQQGDPDAIAGLYRQYVQAIARYVAYRVPDEETVEDLTADVFLRMVEGLPGYQVTGAPFEAWLYRIAATRIADFYRQRQRHPVETLGEGVSSGHTPLEMTLQEREELDGLRAALNTGRSSAWPSCWAPRRQAATICGENGNDSTFCRRSA